MKNSRKGKAMSLLCTGVLLFNLLHSTAAYSAELEEVQETESAVTSDIVLDTAEEPSKEMQEGGSEEATDIEASTEAEEVTEPEKPTETEEVIEPENPSETEAVTEPETSSELEENPPEGIIEPESSPEAVLETIAETAADIVPEGTGTPAPNAASEITNVVEPQLAVEQSLYVEMEYSLELNSEVELSCSQRWNPETHMYDTWHFEPGSIIVTNTSSFGTGSILVTLSFQADMTVNYSGELSNSPDTFINEDTPTSEVSFELGEGETAELYLNMNDIPMDQDMSPEKGTLMGAISWTVEPLTVATQSDAEYDEMADGILINDLQTERKIVKKTVKIAENTVEQSAEQPTEAVEPAIPAESAEPEEELEQEKTTELLPEETIEESSGGIS